MKIKLKVNNRAQVLKSLEPVFGERTSEVLDAAAKIMEAADKGLDVTLGERNLAKQIVGGMTHLEPGKGKKLAKAVVDEFIAVGDYHYSRLDAPSLGRNSYKAIKDSLFKAEKNSPTWAHAATMAAAATGLPVRKFKVDTEAYMGVTARHKGVEVWVFYGEDDGKWTVQVADDDGNILSMVDAPKLNDPALTKGLEAGMSMTAAGPIWKEVRATMAKALGVPQTRVKPHDEGGFGMRWFDNVGNGVFVFFDQNEKEFRIDMDVDHEAYKVKTLKTMDLKVLESTLTKFARERNANS